MPDNSVQPRMDDALTKKPKVKTVGQISLRFGLSLVAYLAFFLKPRYLPRDPWADFTDGSLSFIAFFFLLAVVLRGPNIWKRVAALLVGLPAFLYFNFFVYYLVWKFCHGGLVYGNR